MVAIETLAQCELCGASLLSRSGLRLVQLGSIQV